MAKKAETGLSGFMPTLDKEAEPAPRGRRRAQGKTVGICVRLEREEWERLHHLAVSEGVSLQGLFLEGVERVFKARGLSFPSATIKASG